MEYQFCPKSLAPRNPFKEKLSSQDQKSKI